MARCFLALFVGLLLTASLPGQARANDTCSQEVRALRAFMTKDPHKGMPFGFPELPRKELQTLQAWLLAGGNGPSPQTMARLKAPGNGEQGRAVLKKWNDFLNGQDPKTVTMARYLWRPAARRTGPDRHLARRSWRQHAASYRLSPL